MKPRRSHPDPFLADLLSGAELDTFRAASLEHLLAHAHRRRQRAERTRTLRLVALPALALLAVVWLALPRSADREEASPTAQLPPGPPANVQSPETASAPGSRVHHLTDDELLALFPGRPVALIGPPGNQKFVLLDTVRPK